MDTGSAPRCSSGVSPGPDQAVADALSDWDGDPPSLAIVQACAPGDPMAAGQLLRRAAILVRESSADCTVIGSSAHGVIGGSASVEMQTAVSVWLVRWPGERPRTFRIATVPTPHGAPALTGLPELRDDDRVAVVLADAWSLPVDEMVRAFDRVDGSLPLVGALASGARRAGDIRLVLDGAVFDNGAVGVVLGADAPVRAIVSQGCRPIGRPWVVTQAQGNVILSLAGTPALERVREAVAALDPADQALAVRGLHLGVARDERAIGEEASDYVVRGIVGVDPGSGAIAVGDDVAVGSLVCLHLRDADSADTDLRAVLDVIRRGGEPVGAYLFTCNGRGTAMFTSSDHDAGLVREALRTEAVGGLFAAGEIGPVGGANHVHGFTAVILAVDPAVDTKGAEVDRVPGERTEPSGDLDAELRALLEP